MIKFKLAKNIYEKSVLVKACFNYTDNFYISISQNLFNYIVYFEPKSNDVSISEKEFLNTILEEETRLDIYRKSKNIRELIIARALSSSEIDMSKEIDNNLNADESILNDWFHNEN